MTRRIKQSNEIKCIGRQRGCIRSREIIFESDRLRHKAKNSYLQGKIGKLSIPKLLQSTQLEKSFQLRREVGFYTLEVN